MSLNTKQKIGLDVLKTGVNVFITGGGGVGKSHLLCEYIDWCEDEGKEVIITAPTGIAAINIGGVTTHRAFKAPIGVILGAPPSIQSIFKSAYAVIIEEISMCRIDLFEYCIKMLLALNKWRRQNGMDDIQIIVSGDFFQLPPVITDNEREALEGIYGDDLGKGFAFQSKYWDICNFKVIELTECMRQTDTEFITNLNRLRKGYRQTISYFNNKSVKQELKEAILVCGTNRQAQEKNKSELDKIKSKLYEFETEIEGEVKPNDLVVDKVLQLKVGARVMTLTNDYKERYKNGTFATVIEIKEKYVTIKVDGGEIVKLEKNVWSINGYSLDSKKKLKTDILGTYKNFPLKLAYAITIHKSQGQTYSQINLDPYCWDDGQLYVGLSRVKSIDGLYITRAIQPNYVLTSDKVIDFYNRTI